MTNLDHLSTETLADYAEGLLRESEAASVVAHLSGCADCRAEEMLLASLSDILAADDPGPMPAVYAARIDAALAEVAMTDPISGSFHPESAAVDLTPATLAAASAGSGAAGPSAEVVDLAARRRAVAQGLSRVTTVAASIVLLIGGTVLGLQALNSGNDATTGTEGVAQGDKGPLNSRPTIQPSPIRNAAVPIQQGAKRNAVDGSWTNPDGTIIRRDGVAIRPNGTVIKPVKPKVGETVVTGPTTVAVTPGIDKGSSSRGVFSADKNRPVVGPVATTDPAANTPPPATPDSVAPPASAPADASGPAPDSGASPAGPESKAVAAEAAPARDPYVTQSGATYDENNFAQRVADLMKGAGYWESSVGTADVEPSDSPPPAVTGDTQSGDIAPVASSDTQYNEASLDSASSTPATAESVDGPDAADPADPGDRPASQRVKARVVRCAKAFGGDAIAGDTGVWKGEQVTIVVMQDPEDADQVIGRVVYGQCTPDQPATDNVRFVQVVHKP